ncbi:uncharacterized protein LOC113232868 [Hyposmocoma kahamanoa]|uniref:uncharacterized protein LOC113232868 n=1 Tax=Hyposmocoma kahamanoa TaxID=1477025 RepID=UPI000E6DA033|nr:uncharacterized protein LOC113232868 [Hyposmocoma kahamanoa]
MMNCSILSKMSRLGEYDVFEDPIPPTPHQPNMYLRNIKDPFEYYDDRELKNRYRFRKETAKYYNTALGKWGNSFFNAEGPAYWFGGASPNSFAILCDGEHPGCCGRLALHFSTVCRIIKLIATNLANLVDRFIKFPDNLQAVSERFQNTSHRYPGLRHIIEAIDCSHVKINRPRLIEHSESYRNRKGYFSINVQVSNCL